ncbi:aurora borealis [Nesidiocoris tenuis]|uniref:Protein aurora borealis n=1 Tax=Nesidiocoris tenuis TaxID=355587 RepID=A0ABN7B8I5_9HEMI|nr:aurora borealis [Nesidiocoris tenuis]
MDVSDDLSARNRNSSETPMRPRKFHQEQEWKMTHHESPKSSLLFSAQTRSYEKRLKGVRKVRNPFEPNDPSIFEENTCSPNLLVTGPESDEFSWSIDNISKINPATFESPVLVEEDADEHMESHAQEAIVRYFSSTHSVVTPEDGYRATMDSLAFSTPTAPSSTKTAASSACGSPRIVPKRDVAVQTLYRFPPILPREIEELLEPYFCDNSNDSLEDSGFNTSSLRRKLFFSNLSPVKSTADDSPASRKLDKLPRLSLGNDGGQTGNLSSPDLSPVKGHLDISSISNAEVSMVTVGSQKMDEMEEMVVSMDDYNRIFSSTAMTSKDDLRDNGSSAESGFGTVSHEVSSLYN